MTNQDATEILAEHLVRTALRMLNHGTCPIKDPEELRQVGGDALLSASMMFLHTYCEFEDREIASIFRSCADQLESLGASQRGAMTRDTIPCPPPVDLPDLAVLARLASGETRVVCPPPVDLPDLAELEDELRTAVGAPPVSPEEALAVALALVGVGLETARRAGISAQALGGHVLRLLAAYPCPCAACGGRR